MSDGGTEYQELLDFLYQCPTGLVSFMDDGVVTQINPAAVNLLVAAGVPPSFDNLYASLAGAWPDLKAAVASIRDTGPIVEDHDLVSSGEHHVVIGCTVVRIAGDRLMMVLTDATTRAEIEEQRSQLYLSEQQARRRLEALERNATRLVAATSAEEVAAAITTTLAHSLRLDMTSVRVMRDGVLTPIIGPGLVELLADHMADMATEVALPGPDAVAQNRTIHLRTIDDVRAAYPDLVEAAAGVTAGSLMAIPLRAADKSAIGALVVADASENAFDADAFALLKGIAGQAGPALERATLFDEAVRAREVEHAVAIRLQRALLPSRLVEQPGVEIAAQVSAASDLLTVGGDWYDSFSWPSGEVAVMVGDVVDHDVEAAAKMGRIRVALSARAPDVGPSPDGLLTELDRIARSSDGVEFATAACVVIDPSTGRLRYATAGHPPPILVPDSGAASRLDEAGSMPLGVVDAATRTSAETTLRPGSTIVMYSDGLVERRNESLDVGMDLLAEFVESRRAHEVDELAAAIMEAGREFGNVDDDVLVAVVRWTGTAD